MSAMGKLRLSFFFFREWSGGKADLASFPTENVITFLFSSDSCSFISRKERVSSPPEKSDFSLDPILWRFRTFFFEKLFPPPPPISWWPILFLVVASVEFKEPFTPPQKTVFPLLDARREYCFFLTPDGVGRFFPPMV